MKQQEIFKKIGTILNELKDQYEYLGNNEDQHNDLELELFVANAHFLAEHSEVLRKLNTQTHPSPVVRAPEPSPQQEEKYFEPVVQQAAPEPEPIDPPKVIEPEPIRHEDRPVPHIDLTANGADDDFSIMRHEEPEVIKHELILDESQIWEDEDDTGFEINEVAEIEEPAAELPAIKAPEPEPVKEEPKVKTPEPVKQMPPVVVKEVKIAPATLPEIAAIAEAKLEPETDEPLTINQKISAQLNKTSRLSEQLQAHTITDLKQAITLNDKLLYIRDLFNGYSLAYSEAIDLLNRFQNFAEAEEFLKTNYAVKNHWDTKQATADRLYDLLRRRFS